MTAGFKRHFSRFLTADPDRLHFAAHSHHPWPDASLEAQQQAWLDAARLMDRKWERVLGEVLPETQAHVARVLDLSDPATVAVAPNTHELVMRLLSCWDPPVSVLTTDAEFLSFDRQLRRLQEDGVVRVHRVPARPLASLSDRLVTAAERGGYDLLFASQVLFDSGYVLADLKRLVGAVPDDRAFVVIDGYHGFMAVPTDLSAIQHRAFYLAGGYKYAMAGEGVSFMHCPTGYGMRPRDTGWFAGFEALTDGTHGAVPYGAGGRRFLGATFDPSGMYRFNAVQRWLQSVDVGVADIHARVLALQEAFLAGLDRSAVQAIDSAALVPARDEVAERGNFLAFELDAAGAIDRALADRNVIIDHRGTNLRVGFGIYHDAADVDALLEHLATIMV